MIAIVQKDHVAASNLLTHSLLNIFRWLPLPVPTGDIPHHGFQTQRSRDPQRGGSAPTKRRTEQPRMLSQRVSQGLLAIPQLHPGRVRGGEDQIGMAKSMVADHVPRPYHFPCEIGTLLHKAPN